MCTPEDPAAALTNRDGSQLISRLHMLGHKLDTLRSGVAECYTTVPQRPPPRFGCPHDLALGWLAASRR